MQPSAATTPHFDALDTPEPDVETREFAESRESPGVVSIVRNCCDIPYDHLHFDLHKLPTWMRSYEVKLVTVWGVAFCGTQERS